MEPAVRSPRIEPAISMDRAQRVRFGPKGPKYSRPARRRPPQPGRGERNFWVQRREPKIGLKNSKCHRRLKEQNDTGENPHRNGLSGVGARICGFVRLDGGAGRDRTANPPPSRRTGLSHPSQERNFLMQRRRGKKRIFVAWRPIRRRGRTRKARVPWDKCACIGRSSIPEDWVVGAPGLEPGTRRLRVIGCQPRYNRIGRRLGPTKKRPSCSQTIRGSPVRLAGYARDWSPPTRWRASTSRDRSEARADPVRCRDPVLLPGLRAPTSSADRPLLHPRCKAYKRPRLLTATG
jgi:hypothetical protein